MGAHSAGADGLRREHIARCEEAGTSSPVVAKKALQVSAASLGNYGLLFAGGFGASAHSKSRISHRPCTNARAHNKNGDTVTRSVSVSPKGRLLSRPNQRNAVELISTLHAIAQFVPRHIVAPVA